MLRFERLLLADEHSLVPRLLTTGADATYRHEGSSAIPPSVRTHLLESFQRPSSIAQRNDAYSLNCTRKISCRVATKSLIEIRFFGLGKMCAQTRPSRPPRRSFVSGSFYDEQAFCAAMNARPAASGAKRTVKGGSLVCRSYPKLAHHGLDRPALLRLPPPDAQCRHQPPLRGLNGSDLRRGSRSCSIISGPGSTATKRASRVSSGIFVHQR